MAATEQTDRWYALWTRSHCEQLVHDQLSAKKLRPFLPKVTVRNGKRPTLTPMFSGSLFVHAQMTKESYIEIKKARGLVAGLGQSWDQLAEVPSRQIEAIQHLVGSDCPVVDHPYLHQGQRARVIRGPLAGLEGYVVRTNSHSSRLVLSIELLHRSVATELPDSAVISINA